MQKLAMRSIAAPSFPHCCVQYNRFSGKNQAAPVFTGAAAEKWLWVCTQGGGLYSGMKPSPSHQKNTPAAHRPVAIGYAVTTGSRLRKTRENIGGNEWDRKKTPQKRCPMRGCDAWTGRSPTAKSVEFSCIRRKTSHKNCGKVRQVALGGLNNRRFTCGENDNLQPPESCWRKTRCLCLLPSPTQSKTPRANARGVLLCCYERFRCHIYSSAIRVISTAHIKLSIPLSQLQSQQLSVPVYCIVSPFEKFNSSTGIV